MLTDKHSMKYFSILFISLIISGQSKAYGSFLNLMNLSEDVRDIILASSSGHPMPDQNFQLTTIQTDQVKALSSMDDSLLTMLESSTPNDKSDSILATEIKKVDCDNAQIPEEKIKLEKRVEKRNFKIEAMFITNNIKFNQETIVPTNNNQYEEYMWKLGASGKMLATHFYSISMLTNQYIATHPNENYNSYSLTKKVEALTTYLESTIGEKLPSGILMKEMAFDQMINQSSNWQSTLAEAKNALSSDQKISLVSKLGDYFGNQYNYARANETIKTEGVFVNMQQLLDSVKTGKPGGVCRDIALAQTQALKELGFTNSYVVTFKTNDAGHATVISTDPTTGKIIKFNYGETYEMKKGSGTEALIQDTTLPDHGIVYNIYDTKGKPVTKVATDLDQMLRESVGAGETHHFEQNNFSLNKVTFADKYVNGSLFTGTTSIGEKVYGVSLYKKIPITNLISTDAGAGISKLEGTRTFTKIDQENLYMRLGITVKSPEIKIGTTKTAAEVGGSGELLLSNNKETSLTSGRVEVGKNQADPVADFHLGLKNSYTSDDSKTTLTNKVTANFYPDWNHVASNDKIIAAFDGVIVESGVNHNFSANTRSLVDAAILLKNYGNSAIFKTSLEDQKHAIRYTAGVTTPLSKNLPSFLPGGETKAFTSIEKMANRYTFVLEYENNFTNNSNVISVKAKIRL